MQLKKANIFIAIFLTLHFVAAAQSAKQINDPTILILSPSGISFSKQLEKEVNAQNDTIAKMIVKETKAYSENSQSMAGLAENIRQMSQNGQLYLTHLNFFKQASYLSYNYLVYRFFERFPNELILLRDTSVVPGLASMRELSQKNNVSFIISFPKVELLLKEGKRELKLTVQLYDRISDSYLINQEYTGDEENPGFEFSCNEKTIGCTINNALSLGLNDIIKQIAANNPTLIKQRELSNKRANAIKRNLLSQTYDSSILEHVVPKTDNSIDKARLYQCLYNIDKTQFVAFFITTNVNNTFKSLHDKTDNGKIDIITDGASLDDIPKTYAYIVKGVLYNSKWYYQKDQITYFDSQSVEDGKLMYLSKLEAWNYFKEDSVDSSPTFWTGNLFEKIIDRKKDPKWEKYKDMWATEERENRDYIGLYEIVANQLKTDAKDQEKNYQTEISSAILKPFFEDQVKQHLNNIAKYNSILNDFVFIYPKDKSIILSPVKITDEKGVASIRYFVTIPKTKKIYEWTYFKPHILKTVYADSSINEALGSITKWDFSYDTLDDDNFWATYVLVKEQNAYKYLRPLN